MWKTPFFLYKNWHFYAVMKHILLLLSLSVEKRFCNDFNEFRIMSWLKSILSSRSQDVDRNWLGQIYILDNIGDSEGS